jgi:branched-chain amino acid transport system ATP-binding protein
MTDEVLLQVSELSVAYAGKKVVTNVSLEVRARQIVVVLGPNGAGKTTLLKGLYGLIEEREGSVMLGDHDISDNGPRRNMAAGIGYVPQGGTVFPDLTVEENLKLCSRGIGSPSEAYDQMYEIFPSLKRRRKQRARVLSGGEKQMLAIGMGLMPEPKLLLVDEPSIGLSPALADQVFQTLTTVNATVGTAIVIVEQAVDRALEAAGYAYVMRAGQIVYGGTPGSVDVDAISSRAVPNREASTQGTPERAQEA